MLGHSQDVAVDLLIEGEPENSLIEGPVELFSESCGRPSSSRSQPPLPNPINASRGRVTWDIFIEYVLCDRNGANGWGCDVGAGETSLMHLRVHSPAGA